MVKLDPAFSESWIRSFNNALLGNSDELVVLTETVLSKYGGYIFDGYRRDAPKEWRKTLPQEKNLTKIIEPSQIVSGLLANETTFNHKALGRIDVRLVKAVDVQKLRLLLNSAYKKLADMGLNFSATFQDDDLTAEGIIDGRTFVLEQDDQIIGTMKLRKHNYVDERPCLYLSRFAVRPDLQGNGLGLFLLELAEKLARREGYLCMQLDTAQPAEHLLKFYKNYGFQIVRPIYYEGKTYCSWILEKPL